MKYKGSYYSWGAALFTLLLSSCSSRPTDPHLTPEQSSPIQAAHTPRNSSESFSVNPSEKSDSSLNGVANSRGTIFPAQEKLVNPPKPQLAVVAEDPAGDVTLNMINVDIKEVAKSVLGDLLGLNYVIDPTVQGSITIQTNRPLVKSSVLPAFESALRVSNLALVRDGDVYRVVPVTSGGKQGVRASGSGGGFGTEIVALKYVSPADIRRILEPLLPSGTIVETDDARNLIIVSGTEHELQTVRENVATFDVDWLAGMSFALFTPRIVDARQLTEDLKNLIGGPESPMLGLVRLVPLQRMNAILAITSQPRYLEQLQVWVERLDHGNETTERRIFVYYVQNGRAADLASVLGKALGVETSLVTGHLDQRSAKSSDLQSTAGGFGSSQFSPSPGNSPSSQAGNDTQSPAAPNGANDIHSGSGMRITADETNNALLVLASPSEYQVVETALKKLDLVPLQVLIEASIVEVTLTNELRFGVQWYFRNGHNQFTSSDNSTGTVASEFPGFSYFFSSSANIDIALNALESLTTVKVLSSPELLVLNNQTASLEVGDQVPVATQSAVSTSSAGAPIVNTIEFRDTGVILRVTPRVNEGGLVLMDVSQEVSDVTPNTTSSIQSPTIQQRRISTSVAIQDGKTIALGGLIRDSRSINRGGVPFLDSIPVLGNLFSNKDNRISRTELLVLLTPRVIRSDIDGSAVTDELRRKLPLAAGLLLPMHGTLLNP